MIVNFLIGFPKRQNIKKSENNLLCAAVQSKIKYRHVLCSLNVSKTLPREVFCSDHFILILKMLREAECSPGLNNGLPQDGIEELAFVSFEVFLPPPPTQMLSEL